MDLVTAEGLCRPWRDLPLTDAAFRPLADRVVRMALSEEADSSSVVIQGGPCGVGKTLRAHNLIRSLPPDLGVIWLTCDELADEIAEAARAGDLSTVATGMSSARLVVLDDLDLRRRPTTMEVVCDVALEVMSRPAPIIITTREPDIAARLQARLPPSSVVLHYVPRLSPQLRQVLVQAELHEAGIGGVLPTRVTRWLAAYLPDNGFGLRGFVKRLHLELTCSPNAEPTAAALKVL